MVRRAWVAGMDREIAGIRRSLAAPAFLRRAAALVLRATAPICQLNHTWRFGLRTRTVWTGRGRGAKKLYEQPVAKGGERRDLNRMDYKAAFRSAVEQVREEGRY